NPRASLNYQLGEAVIDGLAPAPVGTHRFEVTFALDADGIFFGEVLHAQTNERKTIKLQRGQDALIEKRRVELADAVARGYVTLEAGVEGGGAPRSAPTSPPVTDRTGELLAEAQRALNDLPPTGQEELSETITQLALARTGNNIKEQGQA